MKPTWEREGVQLYLGDCLSILPHLSGVDAVVTDPPYGIGFKYESHDDTPDDYGPWLWECIRAAEEICSEGSPIFVWQSMKNIRSLSEWFPRNWRLFAAAKNFVQIFPCPMQYAFDPVVVWWTKGKPWAAGTASRDFHIGNTSPTAHCGSNYSYDHPCARPLNQVQHIVEQWARPAGRVLDCFMGSGTTGVACVRTGRRFIGIEIEPKYFEIARRRIEAEMDSQPLIKEAEKKAEQMELAACR